MERLSLLGELIPRGGGDPIPLLRARLIVGRRSRCDIALGFAKVSSSHCELELVNGYWYIRDLNSRNGIKVNGERCHSQWVLRGNEVSIATHPYEIHYVPAADEPPPVEEDSFAVIRLEKAGLSLRAEHWSGRRRASLSLT